MSTSVSVDAVTFAVIRHKLNQVIDEAILALENVSGSPTTAEGHDLMVSLYRADGDLMVGGVGFLHHLSSAAQAVRVIVEAFSEDPGIFDGDAFMLNDSYTAALHPPDVYITSPIFYEGELRGFVANFVHVTDIGAIDPGGFSPNARNRFHEGFQTRGIKLVERGVPRRDVIDTILNQVREPDAVALDLRSQLAANHVAVERMHALYRDYTPPVVDAVGTALIAQSEELMRDRLRELPDGTWRVRQDVDFPDRLHRVELAMRKSDDALTFDFTGTSTQSDVGVNNSYWATLGAVLAPLYPLLAWDMTWNEGMLRPITVVAAEGTLVNCLRPGPVSVATVAMVKVCNNLSNLLLSRMLDASPLYWQRSSAIWDGMHCSVMLSGLQDGEPFIVSITDKFAGAGGAIATHDGVDIGGELPNGVSRWANAETHELHNPVLYLYRRALPDSGGPGAWRGGVTHEFALVPHRADNDSLTLTVTSKGLRVPLSLGLSGGCPGSNAASLILRGSFDEGSGVLEAPSSSEQSEIAQWGAFELGASDVLYQHYMGGGGYGDPLARDPEDVVRDLGAGIVSSEPATEIYGVVARDGHVDQAETMALRRRIRGERLQRTVDDRVCTRQPVPRTARRINAYLQLDDSGAVQCTWCGAVVANGHAGWRLHVPWLVQAPTAVGPERRSLDGLTVRSFLCSGCGTVLDSELAFEDDPPVHDEIERWPEP